MELIVIILVVVLILLIRSGNKETQKKKQNKTYKDFDITKRSSPHPNDTILGNAEPRKSKKDAEVQMEAWNKIRNILSDFTVAGTYYRTLEDINRAENLQIGEELILEKEPTNEFDVNAIKVVTNDSYHIGYIPKYLCRMFNEILVGCEYRVLVNKIVNGQNAPYVHIKVEILDE